MDSLTVAHQESMERELALKRELMRLQSTCHLLMTASLGPDSRKEDSDSGQFIPRKDSSPRKTSSQSSPGIKTCSPGIKTSSPGIKIKTDERPDWFHATVIHTHSQSHDINTTLPLHPVPAVDDAWRDKMVLVESGSLEHEWSQLVGMKQEVGSRIREWSVFRIIGSVVACC